MIVVTVDPVEDNFLLLLLLLLLLDKKPFLNRNPFVAALLSPVAPGNGCFESDCDLLLLLLPGNCCFASLWAAIIMSRMDGWLTSTCELVVVGGDVSASVLTS